MNCNRKIIQFQRSIAKEFQRSNSESSKLQFTISVKMCPTRANGNARVPSARRSETVNKFFEIDEADYHARIQLLT